MRIYWDRASRLYCGSLYPSSYNYDCMFEWISKDFAELCRQCAGQQLILPYKVIYRKLLYWLLCQTG
jgi:hypothetical protein